MEQFSNKAYDKVEVIYNRFKNATTQIVTTETLLPIVASDKHAAEASVDYIFNHRRRNRERITAQKHKMQLLRRFATPLLVNGRMTAMHKATDNATELRDQLKLTCNKRVRRHYQ